MISFGAVVGAWGEGTEREGRREVAVVVRVESQLAPAVVSGLAVVFGEGFEVEVDMRTGR